MGELMPSCLPVPAAGNGPAHWLLCAQWEGLELGRAQDLFHLCRGPPVALCAHPTFTKAHRRG